MTIRRARHGEAAARDARATRLAEVLAAAAPAGATGADIYCAIADPESEVRQLAAARSGVRLPISEATWGLAAGKCAAHLTEQRRKETPCPR